MQLKKHVFDPTIDQWNCLTTELQTAFFYVIIELSRWTRSNTNTSAEFKYELVTLSQKKTRNWKILYAPISGVSVKFKVQNYQIKVDEKC